MPDDISTHIEDITRWTQALLGLSDKSADESQVQDIQRIDRSIHDLSNLWSEFSDLGEPSSIEKIRFSHKFRILLNSIIGFSHPNITPFYATPLTQDQAQLYQDIHEAGRAIFQIVDELFGTPA